MGRMVSVKCPGCGYESRLSLGSGGRQLELSDAIGRFSEDVAREIKQWSERNSYTLYENDVVIGHCEKCGSVEEMCTITFYNTDKAVEFGNTCMICREKLKKVVIPGDDVPCPRCKTSLGCDFVGFWD